MVKFGKNKFKSLKNIAKNQKSVTGLSSNKVLKKKLNADKKVTFRKEVLLKETAAAGNNKLVKNVSAKEILVNELSKKTSKNTINQKGDIKKRKEKPVEKHKKRQKTQINDTKLLFNLMKKK